MTDLIRVSEWDGTPWAGETATSRALVRVPPPMIEVKAATGAGIAALTYDRPLFSLGNTPQKRMEAYLKAYKVGWFYKAESKISSDIAALKIHVAPENTAGENETTVIEPDLFATWESLDPVGKFLRLMERPNPNQTGRQLRQKTQIRIDMAGAAFWYLESPDALYGLPTGIYGISPARMWESRDREGKLVGWVMDRDRPGGGVPFEPSEILAFMTGSADDDVWGVGVVEAVYAEVPLTNLMATHTASVLETGGRLAGMLWPKERTLDEAEFKDAQNAWRSTISNGNAAKRLLLFPEPMEYAQGASTPAEIGIPELALLNRDNILTAFPIDPVQLGVPSAGGLNSGETRRYQRRDYYEGTIHPRVELLEEVIQTGLLSRYEKAVGYTLDFEIEEPNLDDATALLEKTGAFTALRNLGFDEKEAISAVGLDHIKFNGTPAPVAPTLPADNGLSVIVGDTSRQDASSTLQTVVKSRASLDTRAVTATKASLVVFLDEQKRRIIHNLETMLPQTKAARMKADPDWWVAPVEVQALKTALRHVYVDVAKGALQVVADRLDRFVVPKVVKPVIADIEAYGGERIVGISEVTRKAVVQEVAEGIRRGYSIPQIVEGVIAEGFKGVSNVTLENGTPAFSELRAETIARTETTLSYNRAALTGYKAFGIEEMDPSDGDGDQMCIDRLARGRVSVDEALADEDHPNGTLDWIPVIPEFAKAAPVEPFDLSVLVAALKAQREPVHLQVVNGANGEQGRSIIDRDEHGRVIGSHIDIKQSRTVIDRDPDTGRVIGSHEEYIGAS